MFLRINIIKKGKNIFLDILSGLENVKPHSLFHFCFITLMGNFPVGLVIWPQEIQRMKT